MRKSAKPSVKSRVPEEIVVGYLDHNKVGLVIHPDDIPRMMFRTGDLLVTYRKNKVLRADTNLTLIDEGGS